MGPPGAPLTDAHRAFAATNTQVYLVVRRPDGAPIAYPMVGRWADGGLEFSTYRKSAKVRYLEHDDRACCLVVPRERAADERVLAVWGRAHVTAASHERWHAALGRPGEDTAAGITVPDEVRRAVADRLRSTKRIIVRVEAETAAFVRGGADG